MSIQKITNLSNNSSVKKQLNKITVSNSGVSATTNETSLKRSEAIKNNFLSGISFKGHSEKISIGSRGTSGALIDQHMVHNPEHTTVHKGKGGYDYQNSNGAQASVYYADPGEEITDEIKKNHMFIVEYNSYEKVSEEEIEDAIKSSELSKLISKLQGGNAVLKIKSETKSKEIEELNKEVEDTKLKYEQALNKRDKKLIEKSELEEEINESKKNLELAQKKYKIKKGEEEAEYAKMVKIGQLEEISSQLKKMDKNDKDENLTSIKEQIKKYIEELKNKKI